MIGSRYDVLTYACSHDAKFLVVLHEANACEFFVFKNTSTLISLPLSRPTMSEKNKVPKAVVGDSMTHAGVITLIFSFKFVHLSSRI